MHKRPGAAEKKLLLSFVFLDEVSVAYSFEHVGACSQYLQTLTKVCRMLLKVLAFSQSGLTVEPKNC